MPIIRSPKVPSKCVQETSRTFTEIILNTAHLTAYTQDDGDTLLMDAHGLPLTREDFYSLVQGISRWYDSHTDQEIQDIRDEIEESLQPVPIQKISAKDPPLPGVVYLMKSGKYYKIAETSNLPLRKKAFGCHLPHPFEIMHTIPSNDPRSLEESLHTKFSAKRMNGEWFDLTDEDCAIICAMTGDR